LKATGDAPTLLRFLTAGSVDDGKSTLIGRLLYEARGVFEDQLESVRKASLRKNVLLDLSLITDGLRAEREQAITIDVAYRYFATPRRKFIIADTPGHEEYTRNMVTGASTAELAVLLVDARKGVLEQTLRHAYVVWLLGIRRIVVAVNKMDLVGFGQSAFDSVCGQFTQMSSSMSGLEKHYIPLSSLNGDNVVERSRQMPWYNGPSLLELLENIPVAVDRNLEDFRFPVQTVIRPDQDYRGYAGQIVSGVVRTGQRVVALPSGRESTVREILLYKETLTEAFAPQSVVISLSDAIDLGRGDMLADPERMPVMTQRASAELIWVAKTPLRRGVPYLMKHAALTACCSVTRVLRKLNMRNLEHQPANTLNLNEIGTVEIETHKPLFFDPYAANRSLGSFIIVDPANNDTAAAGIFRGPAPARRPSAEAAGLHLVPFSAHQAGGLIVWLTGLSGSGKTTLCNAAATELLARGFRVELLDGDAVRKQLNSDLGFTKKDRDENVRRIGFVAQLLARNGVVVLVSAISPYRAVRDEIRAASSAFIEIYVKASIAVCEQRDPKGLYKRVRAREVPHFTGIDDPYEPPVRPDVLCDTERESIKASSDKIVASVVSFLETGDEERQPCTVAAL
jgi:bifunctional enzyme CysN/CysC